MPGKKILKIVKDCYMRFTVIIMAAVFFQGVILNGAEKKEVIEGNPYGVVAHLNRWEYEQMPQELVLMKQAGIGNVRGISL